MVDVIFCYANCWDCVFGNCPNVPHIIAPDWEGASGGPCLCSCGKEANDKSDRNGESELV